MRIAAFFFLAALASMASAQSVSFTVNTSQTSSISPYIYGINGTSVGAYNNPTFERTGGNRITAYNWTNNYSNAGSDYYYENDNAYSNSTTAGAGMAAAINPAMSAGAGIAVAVPINGYVAKDDPGGSHDVRLNADGTFNPNWLTDHFVPEYPSKPGGPASFTLTPSPTSTAVYEDEFVNWVKTTYPQGFTANTTTPIWFQLDNEPDLWTGTHPEIRPIVPGSVSTSNPEGVAQPLTYAELVSKSTSYAMAIKAVAPNAKILGPVSYGWNGYVNLQNAPDSSANGDFLQYYLNAMAMASSAAHTRLIDAIDLHWYPEATGAGIRITTADSGYSGSTLAALQAARVQAPRSLWDPTYVENSWITSSLGNQAIQLLPREKAKIAATSATYGSQYTANQISISEYNYGGGDDISGGIAEAEALGVFGQQGVLSANEWPLNSNETFIGGGFQMFRNYDGKGSTFGDISLATTNSSAGSASIYASEYSTNSARLTMVAVNSTTGNLTAQLALPNAPNGQQFTQAAIYELTSASATPQFVENIAVTNPASFSYTMPGYSVTTIALTAVPASVWAAAVSGNWSGSGNWTGGVPNAISAIATINASTTAGLTITLDQPQMVGTLFLGNSSSTALGYTVVGTGSNTLTFSNSGSGAIVSVANGAHAINAPVILADNLQVTGAGTGWTLSFGSAGSISGSQALTMNGNGKLILAGQNVYTGVTTLSAGVLKLGASENAGTSGPLGKSAVANPGSILFNGGTLQYSPANQFDYSGRFSTANQAYSVDTNGQNVTWASALTNSGNSLTKIGSGNLTLTSTKDAFATTNVNGGAVAFSGGTIGTFSFNAGAGTSTIGAGTTVTTMNVSGGGVTVNGGTIGTFNFNTGAGGSTIGAGATVTTINVSGGGLTVVGGTIAAFNDNTGAGTSTIGAGAKLAAMNIRAGTVNFNSTQANGTLALATGSTGTVIVGAATGGLLPKVATADFSSAPATATVNATNPLSITGTLKLPGGVMATISNGASFTATGANLANTSVPSTLGLSGGTLTFPTGAPSQMIAVHWAGRGNNTSSPITGTDGVVPNGHWNNFDSNVGGSNLVDGNNTPTTVGVTYTGTVPWFYYFNPAGHPTDLVLQGPGGNNPSVANPAKNVITGIPASYTTYEIIAYINDFYGGTSQTWMSSNPSLAYYGTYTTTTVDTPLQITNTTAGTYPAGNYVIFTGLTGTTQTINLASSAANSGIVSFEIVSAAGPASINLPATAISVTSSSALDLGESGTPSQYHTLGGLSLTANTAGDTRLKLQNALNINFNGISASGSGTASIVNGSNSPVISLAGGSSVSVDPNAILTIQSVIGNSQTAATALTKTGGGRLVLSGTNSYSGGTTVNAGTLILLNSSAIASGTSLTVGDPALFAPVVPSAEPLPSTSPVPEPGTLALFAITVLGAAICQRVRRWRKHFLG